MMIRLTPAAPAQMKWRFALGAVVVMLLGTPPAAEAQGLVKGVQQGAEAGNKAAGPVGGVLGGAIGGVVGVFTGVLGVGQNGQQAPAANGAKQAGSAKDAKDTKGTKGTKGTKAAAKAGAPAVLTQDGAPTLSAEQIVANSDADIDRIKSELNLTPEQEKNWTAFNSAMHYLGHNGADRLNLRIARAQRDPPDDIIEQMRNEAQFLNDRAVDQRGVADAAEPLFTSLDDKQKAVFIQEMVRLSHERGLD
jgi:gas vesicle protein